jgi:hypothetical protein
MITFFDCLLATGRAPNTKRLNLGAVGVELDQTGAVKVTSFPICFSCLLSLNTCDVFLLLTGDLDLALVMCWISYSIHISCDDSFIYMCKGI